MMSQSAVCKPNRANGGGVRRGGQRSRTLYSFEPDATTLFDALLPRYSGDPRLCRAARVGGVGAGIASAANEVGHDNADDLIKALTLEANRERQAQITQEISEIVVVRTRSPMRAVSP